MHNTWRLQQLVKRRCSCGNLCTCFGTRRRGIGGGPGEGCARRPIGTYLYLQSVGAGNPVVVSCLARWGAKRGTGSCDRGINRCLEAIYGGFWKIIISIHQHMDLPLGQSDMFFMTEYSQILSKQRGGGGVCEDGYEYFLAKTGTDGSAVGRGCWGWRRTYGKQR
jgi:hypothetical protein